MDAAFTVAVLLLLVGAVAFMVRCVARSPLTEDSDSTLWSLKHIASLSPPHRHHNKRRHHSLRG